MSGNVTKIVFMPLTSEINETAFKRLLELVPCESRAKICGFKHDFDKKAKLFSEVLARSEIAKALNVPNTAIEFIIDEYGKPHIRGCETLHFNISHTKYAVVLALSSAPVGIDIEMIVEADRRTAKKNYSDDELNYVNFGCQGADRRFFEIWTRKEAYLKYIGTGIRGPLYSFSTMGDERIRTIEKDGYIISVCAAKNIASAEISTILESNIENIELSVLK